MRINCIQNNGRRVLVMCFFSILTYLFHGWDTVFILKKKKDSLRFINDLIVYKALQSVK